MAFRRASFTFYKKCVNNVWQQKENKILFSKSWLDGNIGEINSRNASQLAVRTRMRSVQNIQKITKAMKMVAASKMRAAQNDMNNSRGMTNPLMRLLEDMPGAESSKNITIPISTDKGLCGGLNSTVTKYTKSVIELFKKKEKDQALIVFGEKCKSQLVRENGHLFKLTIADTGKVRTTFSQVCMVVEDILKTEFDVIRIIYNRFFSVISYKPTIATCLSPDTLEKNLEYGGKLDQYELEGPERPEMLMDLCEFNLAMTLYNCLCENTCSEHASRMAAMESSTKNASEMLKSLTLQYNRSRQAAITTELIEIISGASALEESR